MTAGADQPPWRIRLSVRRLDELRGNESFAVLLTLARAVNALRTLLAAGKAEGPREGSGAERNRSSLLLLSAAQVHEIRTTLQRLGAHFRDLPAYRDEVATLLGDKAYQELSAAYFKNVRDKVSFHQDVEVAQRGLVLAAPHEHNLARGSTDQFEDVYYPFADLLAFLFLLDRTEPGTEAEVLDKVSRAILDLSARICYAADLLLLQALEKFAIGPAEADPNS